MLFTVGLVISILPLVVGGISLLIFRYFIPRFIENGADIMSPQVYRKESTSIQSLDGSEAASAEYVELEEMDRAHIV